MAKPLKGWTRLSASRYRNPAGEEVSRRQYDNARLRALGFRSRSEREKLSKSGQWSYFAGLIAKREGEAQRDVNRSAAFARTMLGATRDKMRGGPTSPAASILTMAGLRDPDAQNRVGEGYERKRRKKG